MIGLAIDILWFLIGVIILGGIVWVALYVLHNVFPNLPPRLDQAVWGIFAILCLIYALMIVSGGAPPFRPRFGYGEAPAVAAWRPGHLPGLRA